MGFRRLRVINEDWVDPAEGFPPHSHRDMEIITYILEGALEHKDSMGNASVIRPGEVQRMSAGTGVTHSEYNSSHRDKVHLLQIWILPEKHGLAPGYEQKAFDKEGKRNRLRLVASRAGKEGSVTIHQDFKMYDGALDSGQSFKEKFDPARGQWLQVTHGSLAVNGKVLKEGDGASAEGERELAFESSGGAEFILFDSI